MELTRAELFERIWSEPMGAVAGRYGLTGNGLAKICDRLDIPRPPRSHWTRSASARDPRPDLPPAPIGLSETFALGQRQPRKSPGTRTRMSAEERRQHLMDTASQLALKEGLSAVTIREVARLAGISETQVHNCFGGQSCCWRSRGVRSRPRKPSGASGSRAARTIRPALCSRPSAIYTKLRSAAPCCKCCCARPRSATR